jgi:hypothetical protein
MRHVSIKQLFWLHETTLWTTGKTYTSGAQNGAPLLFLVVALGVAHQPFFGAPPIDFFLVLWTTGHVVH